MSAEDNLMIKSFACKKTQKLTPIHPGEILSEDFMKPLGISSNRLSRDIDVPANRISEIVAGRRAISADTALRLSKYFGTSAEVWMGVAKRL